MDGWRCEQWMDVGNEIQRLDGISTVGWLERDAFAYPIILANVEEHSTECVDGEVG